MLSPDSVLNLLYRRVRRGVKECGNVETFARPKTLNDPDTHHVKALHWVKFPTKLVQLSIEIDW